MLMKVSWWNGLLLSEQVAGVCARAPSIRRSIVSQWNSADVEDRVAIRTNTFFDLDKYILYLDKYNFFIWTNTFFTVFKNGKREAGGCALSAPWGTIRSLPCLCWHKLSSSQNISQEMHKIFLRLGKCIFLTSSSNPSQKENVKGEITNKSYFLWSSEHNPEMSVRHTWSQEKLL